MRADVADRSGSAELDAAAVGPGARAADGGGAASALDGVFGGPPRLGEDLEGFFGDVVVVFAAGLGGEVEEGFVGRADVGLLEPEGEVGEGEGVGLGVGRDGWGGDEGREEGGLGGG